MNKKFLETLSSSRSNLAHEITSNEIQQWTNELFDILFPKDINGESSKVECLEKLFEKSKGKFIEIYRKHKSSQQHHIDQSQAALKFYQSLPSIYETLKQDLSEKFGRPQIQCLSIQIQKVYPEFLNIFFYRVVHQLYLNGLKNFAYKFNTRYIAKEKIFIHEEAKIGAGFVIHKGNSIQIGKTAKIGKKVKLYGDINIRQLNDGKQVQKIGPIIEDNVILLSGATVLGERVIVGHGSLIGNEVCITESVLPNSRVFNKPQYQLTSNDTENRFSIQNLIGNTPLVQIRSIFKHPHVKIFAKLEGQNPGGSVKDRPAYNMIKEAIKRGEIKPGMKFIQPTSGNTGIALAMIASIFNLDMELIMPENSTVQRIQTMEAYGAKVILTPAKQGIQGSRDYAEAQVAKGGYRMLNQFANTDNYMGHYSSTGPEIWRDTNGTVTHFVSSMGTTGTIMGTSMYLKQKSQGIQIVGVQPTQGSSIPGIRRWKPEYLPKIFNKQRVDLTIDVSEQESLVMMRRLAKQQAIFAGVSSGGAMAAAVRLAQTLEKGVIVSIVCDRGDRYLSSGIFGVKKEQA